MITRIKILKIIMIFLFFYPYPSYSFDLTDPFGFIAKSEQKNREKQERNKQYVLALARQNAKFYSYTVLCDDYIEVDKGTREFIEKHDKHLVLAIIFSIPIIIERMNEYGKYACINLHAWYGENGSIIKGRVKRKQ